MNKGSPMWLSNSDAGITSFNYLCLEMLLFPFWLLARVDLEGLAPLYKKMCKTHLYKNKMLP